MKRVAFISDVHSNLEALEAVLHEVEGLELYCLGDMVGYGGSPDEVISLLVRARATALMGNHDSAVLSGETSWFNARAAIAVRWTAGHISKASLEYLRGLPLQLTRDIDGTRVFLTHGSPDDSLHEYVEPESHSDLFAHYLQRLGVEAVGLGHTHIPFVWRGGAGTVFNPGSVGQPRDGDPRASFAIGAFGGGRGDVEVRRVEYDRGKAAAGILKAGLPEVFASRLFRGT